VTAVWAAAARLAVAIANALRAETQRSLLDGVSGR
jgi:hypothetical protein